MTWWVSEQLHLHGCGIRPPPIYTMRDHFVETGPTARSVDKWRGSGGAHWYTLDLLTLNPVPCAGYTLDLLTGVNTSDLHLLQPSPCQTPRSQTCHNQISIVRTVKSDCQQSDFYH